MPLHEDIVAGGDPPDIGKLAGVVLRRRIVQCLFQCRRFDDNGERRAVPGCHFVDVIGGLQASGARHVLSNDRWLAGEMLTEVPCHQPPIEIITAAGRIADRDRDRFLGEELVAGLRFGGAESADQSRERSESENAYSNHVVRLFLLPVHRGL